MQLVVGKFSSDATSAPEAGLVAFSTDNPSSEATAPFLTKHLPFQLSERRLILLSSISKLSNVLRLLLI